MYPLRRNETQVLRGVQGPMQISNVETVALDSVVAKDFTPVDLRQVSSSVVKHVDPFAITRGEFEDGPVAAEEHSIDRKAIDDVVDQRYHLSFAPVRMVGLRQET